MRLTRKSKLILAGVATIAITGGTAFAYWTTSGSGTGTAAVGTSAPVTVNQKAGTTITNLTPGSLAQPIDFTIDNTATFNQTITTVTVSIVSITNQSTGPNPCTAADFSIVQPVFPYGDLTPGEHDFLSGDTGATLQLKNTASNQDACKGATVNLKFNAV